MGERIDLVSPDQASSGTNHYWINHADLDKEGQRVTIHLGSSGGFRKVLIFTGDKAMTYIKTLNKRNATSVSNEKWTLNLLISDGYLNGTVSGTPD